MREKATSTRAVEGSCAAALKRFHNARRLHRRLRAQSDTASTSFPASLPRGNFKENLCWHEASER
jgi:hypothetical protein